MSETAVASLAYTVCDGDGKPLILLLTAGQVSDYCGADMVLPALPQANVMIADKGYDSDKLREALAKRGIRYDRCAHTFYSAICLAHGYLLVMSPEPKNF